MPDISISKELLMALTLRTQETGFFRSWGGSWDTDYGRFFLHWYSSHLEAHGSRVLSAAAAIFSPHRQQRNGGDGTGGGTGGGTSGGSGVSMAGSWAPGPGPHPASVERGGGVPQQAAQPPRSGAADVVSGVAAAEVATEGGLVKAMSGGAPPSIRRSVSRTLLSATMCGSSFAVATIPEETRALSPEPSTDDTPRTASSLRELPSTLGYSPGSLSSSGGSASSVVSLQHGLGSLDMLDVSTSEESATPRTSSSGGTTPQWGSAGRSSVGSLMSEATGFQVRAVLYPVLQEVCDIGFMTRYM